jgi:hypothetical protein
MPPKLDHDFADASVDRKPLLGVGGHISELIKEPADGGCPK